MQQRIKNNQTLRHKDQLQKLQTALREKLGDAEYRRCTEIYTPSVTAQIRRHGCPITAAHNVLQLLDIRQAADTAVQRLVMCAALDVAQETEKLSLAS